MNGKELKYIFVTHHHMIINFSNREALKELWDRGGRIGASYLITGLPDQGGVVRYILKGVLEKSITTNLKS